MPLVGLIPFRHHRVHWTPLRPSAGGSDLDAAAFPLALRPPLSIMPPVLVGRHPRAASHSPNLGVLPALSGSGENTLSPTPVLSVIGPRSFGFQCKPFIQLSLTAFLSLEDLEEKSQGHGQERDLCAKHRNPGPSMLQPQTCAVS